MRSTRLLAPGASLFTALAVIACGGGSGGSTTTAGIDRGGITIAQDQSRALAA